MEQTHTIASRPATGPASRPADTAEVAPIGFFTLADARHFPGLVALVNSLRLQGHREPITVLDLGLDPAQRDALATECDVVAPPEHSPRHPWLLEPRACMTRAADVVVYVDADVILTRDLDGIIGAARAGRITLFADIAEERHFAEWQEIFALRAPVRRQTYANAGFLAFSTRHFPELLPRWAEACERLVGQPTFLDSGTFDAPTAISSQDALNALLMSEFTAEQVVVQPIEAAAQGPDEIAATRVVDVERLRCLRGGHAVALLHAWGSPKPWYPSARDALRENAYLTCLRRLLVGSDVAVHAPPGSLVPWLRRGPSGWSSLWYLTHLRGRRPWRRVRRLLREAGRKLPGRSRR